MGDFVFRPSSQGLDHITLTWLFYKNCLIHIDIHEFDKPVGASIGNKLKIGEDEFENLNEIIERYIIPTNKALNEAISHPKFVQCNSMAEMEEQLKAEKAKEPGKIPYKFAVLDIYPQHVVVSYIPKEKLVKEFIKVKPSGYHFHGKRHNTFQNMINWFKDNFKSRDYQKELRKARSPRIKSNVVDPLEFVGLERPKKADEGESWKNINKEWQQ